MYHIGKSNEKADTLSHRDQEYTVQSLLIKDNRTCILLISDRLNNAVLQNMAINPILMVKSTTIASLLAEESLFLVYELLIDNKNLFETECKELHTDYIIKNNLLLYDKYLIVRKRSELVTRLIRKAHIQVSSAYPDNQKTYKLLKSRYYGSDMKADCEYYVGNCYICQRFYIYRDKQSGLLQSFFVPDLSFQYLIVDFKYCLKSKKENNNTFVIINRLFKAFIIISCICEITAEDMAGIFYKKIWNREYFSISIVSDRKSQFVSDFWKEFCRIIDTKVKLFTVYYKETDRQIEIMNQYWNQYLQSFVNHYMDDGDDYCSTMNRAQFILHHLSINMISYELIYGIGSRIFFDWNTPESMTVNEQLSRDKTGKMVKRMENTLEIVKKNMEKAQDKKRRDVNRYRRSIDFDVGDRIGLSTKNLKTDCPSHKLDNQNAGPFPIVVKEGNSFRLQLPESWIIHAVFASQLLRKDPQDPLPYQNNEEQYDYGKVTDDKEYEVEYIVAVKKVRNKLLYRAKWIGWDEDLTYYPAENFMYTSHKLCDFHRQYPDLPGPLKRLNEWIKVWKEGREEYGYLQAIQTATESGGQDYPERGGDDVTISVGCVSGFPNRASVTASSLVRSYSA